MTRFQQATPPAIATGSLGQPVTVGPWQITVAEVVQPVQAAQTIAETNEGNPEAPDGLQYLLVRVSVQNLSQQKRAIQQVDFGVAGDDGIVRRPPTIEVPEPVLEFVVDPGLVVEGWLPFLVSSADPATLYFDSPLVGGSWAQVAVELGSTPVSQAPGEEEATDLGSDPSNPASIGDTVRTGGFEVTIHEYVTGMDFFDIAPDGVRALPSDDSWVPDMNGFRLTVKNVSAYPAYFSTTAIQVADFDGEPWNHSIAFTPPEPDVSQEYLPGASLEGWAACGTQPYGERNLIRILPFVLGGSPRYVAFDGSAVPTDDNDDEEEAETPTEPLNATVGDIVVTMDIVNLRAEPSTEGEIVKELPEGTELEIIGEASEADDYTWYEVNVVDDDLTGYVVQDFLTLA